MAIKKNDEAQAVAALQENLDTRTVIRSFRLEPGPTIFWDNSNPRLSLPPSPRRRPGSRAFEASELPWIPDQVRDDKLL